MRMGFAWLVIHSTQVSAWHAQVHIKVALEPEAAFLLRTHVQTKPKSSPLANFRQKFGALDTMLGKNEHGG